MTARIVNSFSMRAASEATIKLPHSDAKEMPMNGEEMRTWEVEQTQLNNK